MKHYSNFIAISRQIAEQLIDDIRDGILVPDLEPNRTSNFDERADHLGFIKFLGLDDFDTIMYEFHQAKNELYQFC